VLDPGTHRPGRDRPGRWDPAGWRRRAALAFSSGPTSGTLVDRLEVQPPAVVPYVAVLIGTFAGDCALRCASNGSVAFWSWPISDRRPIIVLLTWRPIGLVGLW